MILFYWGDVLRFVFSVFYTQIGFLVGISFRDEMMTLVKKTGFFTSNSSGDVCFMCKNDLKPPENNETS
jgi:hypothetical protein